MKIWAFWIFSCLQLCFLAGAAERHALVIGNSDYVDDGLLPPVPNCVRDADLIAGSLQKVGYQVRLLKNASRSEMDAALLEWEERLPKGCDALVYFAGHGIEHNGKNYLLGCNAQLRAQSRIGEEALEAETVATAMLLAGAKSSLLFLDCCREAPPAEWVTRGLRKRGLAEVKVDGDIIIAYAAKPGDVAQDQPLVQGEGVNPNHGPYAQAVAKFIGAGLKHTDFFQEVRKEVANLTNRQQRTWENGSFLEELYFSVGTGGVSGGGTPLPLVPATPVVPMTPTSPVDPLAGVSKDRPFVNDLGMRFVPAGTPGVLFSVWETRVKDFEAFVTETGHDAVNANRFGWEPYTLEKDAAGNVGWLQKGGSWQNPRFPSSQTGEHPVVCVSYLDAEAFCAWLTKRDLASGKLPAGAMYRLPTHVEWTRACGPSEYPWGDDYPPKNANGNYCGSEAMVGVYSGRMTDLGKVGFKDGAARTAMVGMYGENAYGLYDMGGNVWEWCSSWYEASLNDDLTNKTYPVMKEDKGGQTFRVLRGGSWYDYLQLYLRSAFHYYDYPMGRNDINGFRCVVVVR